MRKLPDTPRYCAIQGCEKLLGRTHGRICPMHRSRFHRNGTYEISERAKQWGKPGLTNHGYVRINVGGVRVLEHRHVMEQHLGRKLLPGERIHHRNGKKTDNRIENLELFESNAAHIHARHHRQRRIDAMTLHRIKRRLASERRWQRCFCGGEVEARALCHRHYHWARKHRLFTPRSAR